tara:strand:+ start:96 stop:407 length:312 start_codon:yes stop_codon:yes gene_type:complete
MGKRKQRRARMTYDVIDLKSGVKITNLRNFREVSDAVNRVFFSGYNIMGYQTARNLWRDRSITRDCYDRLEIRMMEKNDDGSKTHIPKELIKGHMILAEPSSS